MSNTWSILTTAPHLGASYHKRIITTTRRADRERSSQKNSEFNLKLIMQSSYVRVRPTTVVSHNHVSSFSLELSAVTLSRAFSLIAPLYGPERERMPKRRCGFRNARRKECSLRHPMVRFVSFVQVLFREEKDVAVQKVRGSWVVGKFHRSFLNRSQMAPPSLSPWHLIIYVWNRWRWSLGQWALSWTSRLSSPSLHTSRLPSGRFRNCRPRVA